MKELWYTAFVLLLLGVLAGMANLKPTGAVVGNLPPLETSHYPIWDLPTNEFTSTGEFRLELTQAFFDPDGDSLSFTGKNIEGTVFYTDKSGNYNLAASDGKSTVEQEITVRIN